jgi:cytoskeletal protein RodZ
MMSEPQPEYVWAYPDEKPKRGRVWLIVGLSVLALAIAAAVFWLFIRPSLPGAVETPTPTPSASVSASPSSTPSATATATPTATPSPTASAVPSPGPTATAPPPPAAPDISDFRDKVTPVLSDAQRGLQIAGESDAAEAAQNVGFLQEDAGRLSDLVAPSSISAQWNSSLDDYSRSLQKLRTAYERGGSANSELSEATRALAALNGVVD